MKAITNLIKLNRRFSSLSTSSSSSSRSSDSTSPSWINKYLSSNQNFNSHLTLPLYRCFDSIRNNSPNHQISNTEDLSGEDVISFKLRAIALGIKSLAQHPNKITRLDQLIELQGIGKGIRNRCNMILMGKDPLDYISTSQRKISKLQPRRSTSNPLSSSFNRFPSSISNLPSPAHLHSSPDPNLLKHLQLVKGIGLSKAKTLIKAGCRSLEDLRDEKFVNLLTERQKQGLEDLLGFDQRRKESQTQEISTKIKIENPLPDTAEPLTVTVKIQDPPNLKTQDSKSEEYQLYSSVLQSLKTSISEIDSSLNLHAVGAFRRGRIPSCLELLIEDPKHQEIVAPIREGEEIDAISIAMGQENQGEIESDDDGINDKREDLMEIDGLKSVLEKIEKLDGRFDGKGRKWIGNFKSQDEKMVPVSIRLCSPATLGSSLLFHTGDVHYVRFLRTLASEAFGSHFDSQGLWRKSSDGNSINGWERIGGKEGHPNTHSEEEILDALGMLYLDPQERIVKAPKVKRNLDL